MERNNEHDITLINSLTTRFFNLFTNADGQTPQVRDLESFFLPQGIIINNTTDEPQIYDLQGFIKPREELLSNGSLVNFREFETSSTTEVHGKIAHRLSHYAKEGELNGKSFVGEGSKSLQFVKIDGEWWIVSVAWCDK